MPIHVCLYTYAYTRMPIHVRAYTRMPIHVCLYTYAYTRMPIHVCLYTYAYTRMPIHVCLYTYAYTRRGCVTMGLMAGVRGECDSKHRWLEQQTDRQTDTDIQERQTDIQERQTACRCLTCRWSWLLLQAVDRPRSSQSLGPPHPGAARPSEM